MYGYPEWRALRQENAATIGQWLFEDVLCRWGALEEIVTDNGPAFVAATRWLSEKYGVHSIRISPYNSRANGIVERRHRDVREAIVKSAGIDLSHWYKYAPHVFWAERVTIQRATGLSPYYLAHGVEPLLPFDLEEATFSALFPDGPVSTADLLAARARALQKREEDLEEVRERVFKARLDSATRAALADAHKIVDHDFQPGALVLVRNTAVESDLGRKTRQRYFGPMVVIHRNAGGGYILGELDGSLSRLRYAAFRLVPYLSRRKINVDITHLTGMTAAELAQATCEEEAAGETEQPELAEEEEEGEEMK